MKLNQVVVAVIEAASVAALQAAVNTFLTSPGERTFVSVQYMAFDATHYSAMVIYTN